MKQTTLSKIKDGGKFKISNRKSGVLWERIRKEKAGIVITSKNSDKSDTLPGNTKVYLLKYPL